MVNNYQDRIQFEPNDHIYTVDGNIYPSVSSLIKQVYEPFDADLMSTKLSKGSESKKQDLLDSWAETNRLSIVKGNACHDLGEQIALMYRSGLKETVGLINFWAYLFSKEVEIVETEQPVFSEKYGYAGTPDMLVKWYNEWGEEELVMLDYKTNKNLDKNYRGKRMLAPFEDMLDSPRNHYFLQQNLYMLALKEHGIEVDGAYLIWLYNNTFEMIPVPELDLEEKWLQSQHTNPILGP